MHERNWDESALQWESLRGDSHSENTFPTLEVDEALAAEQEQRLLTHEPGYAAWLRIVVLRCFVHTPALAKLKFRFEYHVSLLAGFLGMVNLQEFSKSQSLGQLQHALQQVLSQWESRAGPRCRFPDALERNLTMLGGRVGLSESDIEILGLCVLIHADPIVRVLNEVLGSEMTGYNIPTVIAPMLSMDSEVVAQCLSRTGALRSTGLLSINVAGRHCLRDVLDLLTPSFTTHMLDEETDIGTLLDAFVRSPKAPLLQHKDYSHVQQDLKICKAILADSIQYRRTGVNFLIWGQPGVGKTEFVKMLAAELNAPLLEICTTDLEGEPITPVQRVRNFSVAQRFYSEKPTLLLFDECEEIFDTRHFSSDSEQLPRKSWINHTLESNRMATFWIANSIQTLDDAFLRRFSLCMEMPVPPLSQRKKMLSHAFGDTLSAKTKSRIANNAEATPAVFTQAARLLKVVASNEPSAVRNSLAIHLINGTLKAQGKAQVCIEDRRSVAADPFDAGLINCDVDLVALKDGLKRLRNARLCLQGPPGTGKTAFGKWLSRELKMPHISVKASDLLSSHVGDTEQKMAHFFDRAREEKALLQIDEVDSFLYDRKSANAHWEITQVNEMLTQMEDFSGIFVASTNLFQNLDEASLRRFDMAIKFGYMTKSAAWAMFQSTCKTLDVANPQSVSRERLAGLSQLTPGDFEQAIRRSRLLPPMLAEDVFDGLAKAQALKKPAGSHPIGFTAKS